MCWLSSAPLDKRTRRRRSGGTGGCHARAWEASALGRSVSLFVWALLQPDWVLPHVQRPSKAARSGRSALFGDTVNCRKNGGRFCTIVSNRVRIARHPPPFHKITPGPRKHDRNFLRRTFIAPHHHHIFPIRTTNRGLPTQPQQETASRSSEHSQETANTATA